MNNQHEEPKLETMDDLRAAMQDPAVTAAEQEMSRRFLKNNRPKSLAVVFVAVAALFLILALSGHKAGSVVPSALRSAETVRLSVETADGGAVTAVLDAEGRDALVALLDGARVSRRSDGGGAETLPVCRVTLPGGETFTLSRSGCLTTAKNSYEITDPQPETLWDQLGALAG